MAIDLLLSFCALFSCRRMKWVDMYFVSGNASHTRCELTTNFRLQRSLCNAACTVRSIRPVENMNAAWLSTVTRFKNFEMCIGFISPYWENNTHAFIGTRLWLLKATTPDSVMRGAKVFSHDAQLSLPPLNNLNCWLTSQRNCGYG